MVCKQVTYKNSENVNTVKKKTRAWSIINVNNSQSKWKIKRNFKRWFGILCSCGTYCYYMYEFLDDELDNNQWIISIKCTVHIFTRTIIKILMLFIHRILGSQTFTSSHEPLAWEKCTYKFSHTIQLCRESSIILINGTTQDAQIILVPISLWGSCHRIGIGNSLVRVSTSGVKLFSFNEP